MRAPDQLQLRAVNAADQGFINTPYFSTRDDLQLLAADPALANASASLIGMQQNAQALSYRANYPDAENRVIEKDQLPVGRVTVQADPAILGLVDISVLQRRAAHAGQEMRLAVRSSNAGARRLYAAPGFGIASQDAQMRWRP